MTQPGRKAASNAPSPSVRSGCILCFDSWHAVPPSHARELQQASLCGPNFGILRTKPISHKILFNDSLFTAGQSLRLPAREPGEGGWCFKCTHPPPLPFVLSPSPCLAAHVHALHRGQGTPPKEGAHPPEEGTQRTGGSLSCPGEP